MNAPSVTAQMEATTPHATAQSRSVETLTLVLKKRSPGDVDPIPVGTLLLASKAAVESAYDPAIAQDELCNWKFQSV